MKTKSNSKQRWPKFQETTRQDVADISTIARVLLNFNVRPEEYALLGDLLDRWSTRAILIALSLLLEEHGDGAAEAFPTHGERALQFLAETKLTWDDPRISDEWKRFQNGEELRAGADLGAIALSVYEALTSEGARIQ